MCMKVRRATAGRRSDWTVQDGAEELHCTAAVDWLQVMSRNSLCPTGQENASRGNLLEAVGLAGRY